MRMLLVMSIALGCKGAEKKQPPPAPAPVVAIADAAAPAPTRLQALPAAATATIDPEGTKPVFPSETPAVVLWRGGGAAPKTSLSVRIWTDGSVRFGCGRSGKLAPERVSAMIDAFDKAGWIPAPDAVDGPRTEPDPACETTSIQVRRETRIRRRDSSCGAVDDSINDAVAFVQAVVGPDPCP